MASTTQLSLGYTILATVVPYLKPFMMAYEPQASSSYPSSGASGGTRFKLSKLATRSLDTASAAALAPSRDIELENENGNANGDGEGEEVVGTHLVKRPPRVEWRRRSARKLGKLRPEGAGYQVSAQATEGGEREGSEREGSDDSERMIITKGVEWSVEYEREGGAGAGRSGGVEGGAEGGASAGEMESGSGKAAVLGTDEIMAVRSHV